MGKKGMGCVSVVTTLRVRVSTVYVDLINDDRICGNIERKGPFEPETLEAWGQIVKPGSEVIDVGAYSGLFSIAAAKLGARPVAIEPMPFLVGRIRENARLNDVAFNVIQAAASNASGTASIGYRSDVSLTAGASLSRKGAQFMKVKTVQLDELRMSRVSAIKIDTERTERDVIEGALRLLERERPVLIVEALTDGARQALTRLLTRENYEFVRFMDTRNMLFRPR